MRPPEENWLVIRSMAFAICGSAFATTRGTLWSSRLINRAISKALKVSSAAPARLRRSVPSCWMEDFLFAIDSFDHGVVEEGPQFFDRLVLAVGPGAIRQQRNRELALGVDPEGRAGVSEMAIRARIEILSGLRR